MAETSFERERENERARSQTNKEKDKGIHHISQSKNSIYKNFSHLFNPALGQDFESFIDFIV